MSSSGFRCEDFGCAEGTWDLGIFEGLKISAKKSRLHDHGITASEENISDLRVIFEVGEDAFSITLRKFQV